MGCLYPVYVYIVVCEYGASYRRYAYRTFGKAHFGYHLCHEFVYHAVGATGAIVHVHFVKEFRLFVYLVFLTDYIVDFHWLLDSRLFNYFFFECHEYLFGAGYDTAEATEMLHGEVVMYGKAYILYHLAGV